MKENFNSFCKIVSRISIRSWEEWVKGFSNLFNKILYDLKPGYIYGLLPVSGLLSRRRCWWGPRPPRTVGLAARLFWGSPRESGACRPRLFDRSAGSCRWRGACGPTERRWVWREGPHWPSWRADQGLTSSSGWRLLLFRVRTALFRSGLCSSSWERYLLFCADWQFKYKNLVNSELHGCATYAVFILVLLVILVFWKNLNPWFFLFLIIF